MEIDNSVIVCGVILLIIIVVVVVVVCWCNSENFGNIKNVIETSFASIGNYYKEMSPVKKSNENLKVWGWGINERRKDMEEMSGPLLKTCKHFGINPDLIGIGVKYTKDWDRPVQNGDGRYAGHGIQRFYVLRDALEGVGDDQIILVTDASDVLIAGDSDEIVKRFKKMNTRILFSAEKGFMFQYGTYKPAYLENNKKNDYKFIAAGTYIGYAKDLKKMIDECIEIGCVNSKHSAYNIVEMGVMGSWVHHYLVPGESMNKTAFVRLDTGCELFWVTTGDKEDFLKNLDRKGNDFYNPTTDTYPIILHIVGGAGRDKIDDFINRITKG